MLSRIAIVASVLEAAQSETLARKGQEVHCVGGRAHLVHYDVEGVANDGSSLKGVNRAVVSVTPSPAHAESCLGEHDPEGDKQFCYGANQDASCKAATADIPIKDGFDCKDCFVSASADAYYKLNYTMTHLNSVEVGLRDINLRASVGVHKHLSGSDVPASGNLPWPGSDKPLTLIDELVGCPVCVKAKITVAFPTSLDYTLSLSGEADFEAGAVLDINLGDNVVKYDGNQAEGSKWSHQVSTPKVSVSPILSADAKATADLKLDVKTSAQVNVDNIIWYHLNMVPALDTKATFDGHNLFHNDRVCLNGDAAFTMGQEADLNWDLKVWHAKDHWGPKQLFSWSKPGLVHGCKDIKIGNSTSVIV
jgi:hypothetical protein